MSPGPSLAMVMRNTVIGTRLHGIATAVSHALGIGCYALFSVTGLVFLLNKAPIFYQGLTWAGAAYIAWLGWQGLTAKAGMAVQLEGRGNPIGYRKAVQDGFMISLLNPKIFAFFVALFSQFLGNATDIASSAVMVITPMFIDGAWYSLMAVLISQTLLLNFLRRNAIWLDRAIGGLLILIALRVIFGFFTH